MIPSALTRRRGGYPTTLAVSMTAAASGSSGITVADDDDIDFGTGNFTIHWEGALPDWTNAAVSRMWYKYQDANNRFSPSITAAGLMNLFAVVGGVTIIQEPSAASVETVLSPGQNAKLTYVCTRETASTAGTVAFYINGALFDTQTIPAAATVSISNTGQGNISCSGTDGTGRLASTTRAFYLYNRALSAAEVLSLCNDGVATADVGASQTALYTSNFSAGVDSFATSNATGTGNIDSIGGKDNTYRFVSNGSANGRAYRDFGSQFSTTNNRVVFEIYRPASNSTVTQVDIRLTVGASGVGNIALGDYSLAADAWTTISIYIPSSTVTGGQTALAFYFADSTGGTTNNTSGDTIYIASGGTLVETGCTLQLAPTGLSASGLTWTDSSGNGNNGTLPASGATKVTIRK